MSTPCDERLAQVRRREGVVDHERDAGRVGDVGDAGEVEDVALRVADALAVERLRVRADRGLPGVEVVGVVDEADLDAQLRERVVQLVVGAAVERRARHDVPAVLGEVEQRDRLGGLAARRGERADATLERGDAVLEHGLGRVHDPRVDVAELGEPEEVRGVLGVAEDERRRLVDRHRPRARGRVGLGAGVDLTSLESPIGHDVSPRCVRWRGPATLRVQSRPVNSGLAAVATVVASAADHHDGPMTSPVVPPPAAAALTGNVGKPRGVGVTILLMIVTLGIYAIVWQYFVFEENKRWSGVGIGGLVAHPQPGRAGSSTSSCCRTRSRPSNEQDGTREPDDVEDGLWSPPAADRRLHLDLECQSA